MADIKKLRKSMKDIKNNKKSYGCWEKKEEEETKQYELFLLVQNKKKYLI